MPASPTSRLSLLLNLSSVQLVEGSLFPFVVGATGVIQAKGLIEVLLPL